MLGLGATKIDRESADWNDEDKQMLLEYAMHPRTTSVDLVMYLKERGIVVTPVTAHRWRANHRAESKEVAKMRLVFENYHDLQAYEVISYIAGITTELVTIFSEKLKNNQDGISSKDVAAFATIAKEARVAAMSIPDANSGQSMKELEGSLAVSFSDKLDKIFAEDSVMRERVKSACKAAMIDIEAQY